MIRSLFVSLFFFFGPALLLFMLRNLTLLLLLRAKNRRERAREPEVIDITPVDKERAPNWFYALVVAISLASAVTVFMHLQHKADTEVRHYVPAHMDEAGNLVPGHWQQSMERPAAESTAKPAQQPTPQASDQPPGH
ncbi:MAG: hypothetical protein ACE5DZ_06265 [Mariprofundus sp.]